MQPIIVSARKAKKDVERIRGLHSNLLEGMLAQQQRVQQFNDQQGMMKREQEAISGQTRQQDEDRKLKSTEMQNNTQKESMNYDLKTKELEIKRQALMQSNTE